jgi:hypothetical protein
MEPLPNSEEQRLQAKLKRKWVMRGILGWGLLMFVVMTGLDYRENPRFFPHNTVGLAKIALSLMIWLTAGYFWGLWMWRSAKRRRKF